MIHVIGGDVIQVGSPSEGPRYLGFSAVIEDGADEQKTRAQLKVLFESDLDKFFNQPVKAIKIIELD